MSETQENGSTEAALYAPRPLKWIDDGRQLWAVTDVDAIVYSDGKNAPMITILRENLLDVELNGPMPFEGVPIDAARREAAEAVALWLSDSNAFEMLRCDEAWWSECYYAARDEARRG